ncbi:alpha/beta fold hydrolase [Plastorhodobacter daqingensis]|uniref:Alpha/beta fold hydrolase n=1 Tax=Plastorhodobacter daqingensis TaxID=1387281 RepID=A0ABW2UT03_9RHOB
MTTLTTRDHHIQTERGKIFARRWLYASDVSQDRAPILLFHESLGCIDLWRGFPEKLALTTGRPVIAYDRLGFGRSDPYPGELDVHFVSEEAETIVPLLRDQLEIARFVVCGHSVGGGMAIATAARFPNDCTALVTMGAQAFAERHTLDGIRLARAEYAKPENLARLKKYHGDKAKWVVDAWIETWLDPAFADWNLDDAIARVRCPVLAVHGGQDEYGSTEHPRRIADGRGTVEILPGVGHVPYRENEQAVLALIGQFLSGI